MDGDLELLLQGIATGNAIKKRTECYQKLMDVVKDESGNSNLLEMCLRLPAIVSLVLDHIKQSEMYFS